MEDIWAREGNLAWGKKHFFSSISRFGKFTIKKNYKKKILFCFKKKKQKNAMDPVKILTKEKQGSDKKRKKLKRNADAVGQ